MTTTLLAASAMAGLTTVGAMTRFGILTFFGFFKRTPPLIRR